MNIREVCSGIFRVVKSAIDDWRGGYEPRTLQALSQRVGSLMYKPSTPNQSPTLKQITRFEVEELGQR